ncbi:heme-binding domain-containing protein [Arachidicoccus soli]|uniref:Cytochrome P460 n=1 Tax=Arachidicoccus soli TaxID=2341117 RepID=A0A386HRF7_9BACT|nr:heme-binding domain-containing protein [Arachidicoccus soli]AYD48262.1 cytochrome P460 [Arachidicoccus soli]
MKNKKIFTRKWKIFFLVLIIGFISLQFIQPSTQNPKVTGDLDAPIAVKQILKRACYDCHSNETKIKWFDKVAPFSWLVSKDIIEGRKALNFSTWKDLPQKQQDGNLYTALNFIILKEMPLKQYLLLHKEAILNTEDIEILKKYVTSRTAIPIAKPEALTTKNVMPKSIHTVASSLNGIHYIQGYDRWQAISSTDRFDNGTMRVIYANAIAINAIKKEQINPWPEGTIFAKVLWKEIIDSSGNVSPGKFIHSEFMIKDSKKYATTDGWGWARWVGDELKPYGKTSAFVAECMDCHQPMKKNDFVFTMPISLN